MTRTRLTALTTATLLALGGLFTAASPATAAAGGKYMYIVGRAACHAAAKDAQSQGFTVTAWCLPAGNNIDFLHFNY